MPIPRHPAKHDSPAHFSPEDHLDYFRNVGLAPGSLQPAAAIFCYQRALLRHVVDTEQPSRIPCVTGMLYPLPSTGGSVVLAAEFGIGAPAAAMTMELLVAMGVRRFINIGTAGGLTPNLTVGDLTICTAAIRDEGVSHHYLADPHAPALPTHQLTEDFAAALHQHGLTPPRGSTWTTDAPFRETRAEIAHYQQEGVLTVEMETAALFAVAHLRQVEIAAGFVISDVLSGEAWNPQFRAAETARGLVSLFEAARATLAETPSR
ncbi:nucleoside phosphorylase [Candidatus Chloroploca sp. Khr17]|uniref:nucleoside phosphorylase n=1 Tax=Candidatus Chloroploca sp. Khr17 TaxID=2496869 RepID=UPI00101BA722|nr:nucleoside phosphorylase [Candidatus Chloroploca sp. Khr17]